MAKEERRLGKGLGALLGDYLEEGEESQVERRVPVERIRPNPYQPRTEMQPEGLSDLVESIRENGLLQPLVVRPADDGWELVAGERRWRALKKLGWRSAPVIVRRLENREMLVLAMVENLQREDLSPIEEARGYRELVEGFELTQREVAERVGRDRSTVANTLRLLTLDEKVQAMLADGRISAGHGRAILGLEEGEAQRELAREVVAQDLSVRDTERRVRELRRKDDGRAEEAKGPSDSKRERGTDALTRRAEQILERALGTEVRISLRGKETGRIGITFHDSEEFRRLLSMLVGDRAEGLFEG